MGSKGKGRDKEKIKDMRVNLVAGLKEEIKKKKTDFFLKIYEDELDSKAIQQPFPGNGARNTCWYFLTFTE